MFVPIDRLEPVMGDLIALGRPSSARPWLGANLQDLDGQVVVRRVAPEGPAAAAGIQHRDRVVEIDRSEGRDRAGFYCALLRRGGAGSTVEVTVHPQGRQDW